MRIALKAPMMAKWILTDDELIKKNKAVKLTSIKRVTHTGTDNHATYGVIQAIYGPGDFDFITVSYPYEHRDIGIAAAKYIFGVVEKDQNKIKEAKAYLSSQKIQSELNHNTETSSKIARKTIALLVAIICFIALILFVCTQLVSCHNDNDTYHYSDNDDYDSDKDGFVGSDGEYHPYIPEFGEGVNDWMEENW